MTGRLALFPLAAAACLAGCGMPEGSLSENTDDTESSLRTTGSCVIDGDGPGESHCFATAEEAETFANRESAPLASAKASPGAVLAILAQHPSLRGRRLYLRDGDANFCYLGKRKGWPDLRRYGFDNITSSLIAYRGCRVYLYNQTQYRSAIFYAGSQNRTYNLQGNYKQADDKTSSVQIWGVFQG